MDELNPMPMMAQKIDDKQAEEWTQILQKYKAGKTRLDLRLKEAEKWWKLRNQYEEQTRIADLRSGLHTGSAWLHNIVVNKHAAACEAYPQPNIKAREESDKPEAWALTQIIPCVLEQNHFEQTYSDVMWKKEKTGTGVYKVIWDAAKNGIGDIHITSVDLLNLFWEPGVQDIQDSKYLFHTEMMEKEDLKEAYPELTDKIMQSVILPAKEPTDDNISDDGKVIVVDVYYKKGKKLHYAKYVGNQILYATENDPQLAERGLYDHGLFPYVFDVLYPVEGSPAGYGHIDINCNSQTRIDMMNAAFLRNTLSASEPRYFERADSAINEEEFLDLNNIIVHVSAGTLDEQDLKQISSPYLQGAHFSYYENTITELRETSGNNDAATGAAPASVTSASGIAALQEAAQQGNRDEIRGSYRAYEKVINLCIELIRQFYDLPRQFRITGQMGIDKYIQFQNTGMQPQPIEAIGGQDMGYRLPVYDISIEPQKKSRYTQVAQNELAKELFGMRLFEPQMADQALMVLEMMDFEGKDKLMQRIAEQGTMYQTMLMWQQFGLTMAQQYRPDMVPGLAQQITSQQTGGNPNAPGMSRANADGSASMYGDKNGDGQGEHPFVEKARERARGGSTPA